MVNSNENVNTAKDINGNNIKVDANNDGEIDVEEALLVYSISVGNLGIQDMNGLEFFTNIRYLYCEENLIDSIDVSQLINLIEFNCSNNSISNLSISNLINLVSIDAFDNELNLIVFLDNTSLESINLSKNQLEEINFDEATNIQSLLINENLLESLDVSLLTNLNLLEVNSNNLNFLNLQNTINSEEVGNHFFNGNFNLEQICVDLSEENFIQNLVDEYGYTNCNVEVCLLNLSDIITPGFTVFPNPVYENLNIEITDELEINTITIFNNQGQKIISQNIIPRSGIDISQLQTGSYFLKIDSNQGVFYKEFIKK